MLDYDSIRKMVREDLDQFDFTDSPIDKYADHCKSHYIQMATQLTYNFHQAIYDKSTHLFARKDTEDFIHGLNHCFMWGVAAGQNIERNV